MKAIYRLAMAGVSLGALVAPFQVLAQGTAPATAPAAADEEKSDADIVVVGTLIRGTTAVGSQTLTLDSKGIMDKAAFSTNELLGAIPQIANTFNGRIEGDPRGYKGSGTSITRPNLRNIPSVGQTSGALTLLLADGLRLTPVGVNQSSADADIVPAGVIEGVDVVTDGGSSIYGADAVAGVINFRTLRKFEGVKLDGNLGFGTTIKGWDQWDASITAGKSWTGGNAYIFAAHSFRNIILNGEVPWSSGLIYNAAGVGAFSGTQCNRPVGTETRWFRFNNTATGFTNNPAAPGAGTFATGTPCDQVSSETYFPKQRRTNVWGAVSQELGDNADLRVTGYWMRRDTELSSYPRGMTAAGSPINTGALVGAAFPGAAVGSLTAIPGGIGFAFEPNAAYVNTPSRIRIETWGITPELTYKFGGDWQVRASLHYGRSNNVQTFPGVDTVKGQCYITGCTGIAAGQLNPSNVGAASAAVVNDILNFEDAQQTKQSMFLARAVVDGPLFPLPGGDAKVAIGAEFQDNRAEYRLSSGAIGSVYGLNFTRFSRNSKSLYAEVQLPVFSFVDLSASFRYDNYSDFGSTTNPSVGVTLKPTSWLKFFGHWNTSFNAPTAVDGLSIGTGRFACVYVANGTPRPTDPLGRDTSKQGACALVLQGSQAGLKPQTATSWAVGLELTPARGFSVGGQFYSIDLANALGSLNPSITSTYTTNPNQYTYNLTAAQYSVILAQLVNGAVLGAQQPANNIAIVVDTRVSNLNAAKLEGVDFHVKFDGDVEGLGRLSAGIEGTRATRALITNGGVTATQLGVGSPAFTATTWLGLTAGRVSTKVTLNYSGRFTDNGANYLGVQEDVSPFTTVNFNFGYNFDEMGGALSGTSFRLTVDNLFEATPTTVRRANTNNPSYNNWTFGRVIKLGVTKKF